MADYPEWVLKHKKKGTYINYSNGKYYLYSAHSERIPGTKKVRRVCDAYLGRITPEDGLIPPKDKVSGDVLVFEYGLSSTILFLCSNIHAAFRRSFKGNADFIMSAAALTTMYGHYNQTLFQTSFLSIRYPLISLDKIPTDKQEAAINRAVLMITDTLHSHFKEDFSLVMELLPLVHKIKINHRFYLEKIPPAVLTLKKDHQINWEED